MIVLSVSWHHLATEGLTLECALLFFTGCPCVKAASRAEQDCSYSTICGTFTQVICEAHIEIIHGVKWLLVALQLVSARVRMVQLQFAQKVRYFITEVLVLSR